MQLCIAFCLLIIYANFAWVAPKRACEKDVSFVVIAVRTGRVSMTNYHTYATIKIHARQMIMNKSGKTAGDANGLGFLTVFFYYEKVFKWTITLLAFRHFYLDLIWIGI